MQGVMNGGNVAVNTVAVINSTGLDDVIFCAYLNGYYVEEGEEKPFNPLVDTIEIPPMIDMIGDSPDRDLVRTSLYIQGNKLVVEYRAK